MNNDIKKLYDFYRDNALLITKVRTAGESYRKQFHGIAGSMVSEISHDLGRLESHPEYLNAEAFQNGLMGIIRSYQSEDYVLCADLLNCFTYDVMLPLQHAVFDDLKEYISGLYDSLTREAGGLTELQETAYGYPTLLCHSEKDRFLCSTEDPMGEGFALAKENFAPETGSYHIWGMGLGYHVYALYQITHGSTDIYVYDNDPFMFELARSEKLGSWQGIFKQSNIHLVTDPDLTAFSSSISEAGKKIIIHMPSLHKLPESDPVRAERKNILKKLQITVNSFEEQKDDIYLNFYKNLRNSDGFAEDMFPLFRDQNVILVAAGPSLDKNIRFLKKAACSDVPVRLICVGTVLKKLIKEGITPDAFFEMDASKIVYSQIEGAENQSVPLILDSSTYFGIAQNYRGKKYLACQKDFAPAEKTGHVLFSTGSSVTTLALDFAIRAGAKRIILVGCDMAFTGDSSHATDTVQRHDTSVDRTIQAKGYYGNTVSTSVQLSIFREWIENRIKDDDVRNIDLINSTEGGAFIEGMKHIPLTEALETL